MMVRKSCEIKLNILPLSDFIFITSHLTFEQYVYSIV